MRLDFFSQEGRRRAPARGVSAVVDQSKPGPGDAGGLALPVGLPGDGTAETGEAQGGKPGRQLGPPTFGLSLLLTGSRERRTKSPACSTLPLPWATVLLWCRRTAALAGCIRWTFSGFRGGIQSSGRAGLTAPRS